jgi:hypothetical protein
MGDQDPRTEATAAPASSGDRLPDRPLRRRDRLFGVVARALLVFWIVTILLLRAAGWLPSTARDIPLVSVVLLLTFLYLYLTFHVPAGEKRPAPHRK